MRLIAKTAAALAITYAIILPGVVLAVTPNSCCVGGDCAGNCMSYEDGKCDAGYTAVFCSASGAGGGEYCCPAGSADCCNQCTPKTTAACPAGTTELSCTDAGLNKPCQAANAAPKGPAAPKNIPLVNPLGTASVQSVLGVAARVMLGLAGTAALAMFVWGGITWMLSRGNPKEVERGRAIMVWTAVGLAVMFGAEALVRAVLSALSSGAAT